mmetsp:Transcript_54814/g.152885  ORF Transcript_54814/g.152885 Transcript_54814/m.152885 type:complete len:81 (-) Transcript_54814:457-699(-)
MKVRNINRLHSNINQRFRSLHSNIYINQRFRSLHSNIYINQRFRSLHTARKILRNSLNVSLLLLLQTAFNNRWIAQQEII